MDTFHMDSRFEGLSLRFVLQIDPWTGEKADKRTFERVIRYLGWSDVPVEVWRDRAFTAVCDDVICTWYPSQRGKIVLSARNLEQLANSWEKLCVVLAEMKNITHPHTHTSNQQPPSKRLCRLRVQDNRAGQRGSPQYGRGSDASDVLTQKMCDSGDACLSGGDGIVNETESGAPAGTYCRQCANIVRQECILWPP